jgi:hypothetical protein
MRAPNTNTRVNDPNATRAARRLFAADAATCAGETPAIDGGSTGSPAWAATGGCEVGVAGSPAAGRIGGGDGLERFGFVAERGMPDAALRSMMTVPWSAMSFSSSSGWIMEGDNQWEHETPARSTTQRVPLHRLQRLGQLAITLIPGLPVFGHGLVHNRLEARFRAPAGLVLISRRPRCAAVRPAGARRTRPTSTSKLRYGALTPLAPRRSRTSGQC